MTIYEVVNGLSIMITNEEKEFIDQFGSSVNLNHLDEHSVWLARNLVRKGVYIPDLESDFLIKA